MSRRLRFYFAAKLYGVQLIPIRSDSKTGLDLDEFERAVAKNVKIRCVICSPNFSLAHRLPHAH